MDTNEAKIRAEISVRIATKLNVPLEEALFLTGLTEAKKEKRAWTRRGKKPGPKKRGRRHGRTKAGNA